MNKIKATAFLDMNEEEKNQYIEMASVNPYLGMSYGEITNILIREKYSESEEFSLLRQKETKPEEYAMYDEFCEACKAKARKLTEVE